jgi:hypothetical protein
MSSSNTAPRPADTVRSLGEYLYWLLPGFLKKKGKEGSLVYGLCTALGSTLDDARDSLRSLADQFYAERADAIQLSKIGAERDTIRQPGEDLPTYRARVLSALSHRRAFGTLLGVSRLSQYLGYTVEISEPYKGSPRWSHFVVRILSWDGANPDQLAFFRMIRRSKPAHTRVVIDCEIDLATWDDWEDGIEEPKQLDSGDLDDWLVSS